MIISRQKTDDQIKTEDRRLNKDRRPMFKSRQKIDDQINTDGQMKTQDG